MERSLRELSLLVEHLEADSRDLRSRVEQLESNEFDLVSEAPASSTSFPELPTNSASQGAAPSPNFQSAARATAATASSGARSGSAMTKAFRTDVAEQVGVFLKRCLANERQELSGREQVNLPSRVYILARDINDHRYNQGVWPLERFATLRGSRHKLRRQPTRWEAKLAVAAAGLEWPRDECQRGRSGAGC